ncbi:hypothetical protein SAMN02745227_01777 [Anaerobranca californiensis DSM 14826]|jgi:hypothetical protein|uniref:Uncharacterized protein n=1 Tax=Anaerobranca californiensis DSM 14826 TaxID=1120989 RepID=A0A1M6QK07_9FIRM|nr:hypothetical protein [Anaerobranca californiensis]SHK20508.1 hypothetical protein SAMN02745227_01777 [Anaerobranca californiensis DSM 14826]
MKGIKVAIILFFFFFGMTILTESKPTLKVSRNIKEEVITQITLRNYQKTREAVKNSREYLFNRLDEDKNLDYKSLESQIWQKEKNRLLKIVEDLQFCLEFLDSKNPLYIDIQTVERLIKVALEYHDYQALVDAYKILHDLEHYFFYYNRNEIYYGVTQTLSGKVKWKTKNLF